MGINPKRKLARAVLIALSLFVAYPKNLSTNASGQSETKRKEAVLHALEAVAGNAQYVNFGEDSHMRTRKTRVIGVETTSVDYLIFRYGENKFGGAVRSLQWAQALPKTGRGLIFGGSGHFTDPSPINFQDLQKTLNPRMKLFVMEAIKMRQAVK